MRKLVLIALALTCLGVVTMTRAVDASPTSRSSLIRSIPTPPHHDVTNGVISVGSTWTYYDWDFFTFHNQFCEQFTFGSDHMFNGDKGDSGTWKASVKLTFNGSDPHFPANGGPWKYTGKHYAYGFNGVLTIGSANPGVFGVGDLVSGNDPLNEGGC